MFTASYGSLPDQVGDCYISATLEAPLVCLLHGGFWRMPYGRDQLDPLARTLNLLGFSVWNIGYRRVGNGGASWPATLDDVRAAFRFLPELQRQHPGLSLRQVTTLGHSAGGHLAFWAGIEAASLDLPYGITRVIGLAPVLDLIAGHRLGLGPGAVKDFLGGTPESVPDRYAHASPLARLPLRIPQGILHGAQDTDVPPAMSRAYAAAAQQAGDEVTYTELRDVDHMALIDPTTLAFPALRRLL